MNEYHFACLDAKAITFTGLSRRKGRRIAILSSIGILLGLMIFMLTSLARMPEATGDMLGLALVLSLLVDYILTGRFWLKNLAVFLVDATPLGVLYNNDQRILKQATDLLLTLSDQVDFSQYLDYRKINTTIGSRKHLLVIAHQRRGDLPAWVAKKSLHLKALADLVYQIHLAEQVLEADHRTENTPAMAQARRL